MSRSPRHRRPLIEALEPRLLFSATADIAVFDDGASDGQYLAQAAAQTDLVSIYMPSDPVIMENQVLDDDPQADLAPSENPTVTTLVFVDTAVDNYETLVDDIRARVDANSVAIVYLDSSKDGLEQISDYLAGASGISAIHIISHGVAGNLQLGTQVLNENNIDQFNAQLSGWQTALDGDADILLYGCDLAANESGLNFLRQLSNLTGADIAASNDLTGNKHAQADWVLEERVGIVETESLFAANEPMAWQGALADVTYIDTGAPANPDTNSTAITSTLYPGQTFQYFANDITVDRIALYIKVATGAQNQTITLELHSNSWNGTQVASYSIGSSSLPNANNWNWVNFNFNQVSLDNNTSYWIKITSSGTDGLVRVAYHPSSVFNDGTYVENGSSNGARDLAFMVVDRGHTPPDGADNTIGTQEDTSIALTAANFGFSDSVDNNNFAGIVISSLPGAGTLTLTGSGAVSASQFITIADINAGKLVFTPAANASAASYAQIGFQVRDDAPADNTDLTPNTLTINVTAVNDAPTIANALANQNATEDSAFNFQFAANTFADVDVGNTLTYTAQLAGGGALPTWLSFDAATRTFSGTPLNANVGTVAIDVIANDGNGGTVTDTFDIVVANVNDAPTVSIALTDYYTNEQTALNLHGTGITVNDVDSNTVTVTIAGPAPHSQLTANVGTTGATIFSGNSTSSLVITGTLNQVNDFLSGNNGGTLTFRLAGDTPAATATLTITANDGALSGNDTATINITALNDAPVNTVPGAQATDEDTALEFSAGNGNQIQVNDLDEGVGDLEVTLSVTNGTLTLAGVAGLVVTTGDGTSDSSMVFRGTQAAINTALATLTFNPTANFNGASVLTITTSDLGNTGSGGVLTDTDNVNITVNAVNDAPTIANAIANQNATEDSAFNFQFAANVFADVDVGNTLTYTAQLAGGGALPTWLSFDAATRTFSGTPLNANVGTVAIDVIANDGNGETVTDTFNVVVANSNDAPTIANAIANQNATEDSAFNFQFAANTFADVDVGNTLTYTAQLAGGGALPAWLSFNSGTRTFSGTPTNAFVGTVSIDVIANDGNGGTVTDTFDIVVANINDAPTVANVIPNQNATEDAAFNFQFAANTFDDVDVGATLTYSAQLAGGGALPAWLSFDAATRTFSGTPTNAFVGTVSIDVIADDGNGGTVTDTFDIVVANTNDAPTVANPIPNQTATEDALFNFSFAVNTFIDQDVGNTLTYTAQLAGGGALPAWLIFDGATRTFSGTPSNGDVGIINVEVIATDGSAASVSDFFDLQVENVGSNNVTYETSGPAGNTQSLSAGVPLYQSFFHDSAGPTYTVDSIIIQLVRDPAASAQTITVSLISSAHDGVVLASDTMSSADINTAIGWKAFTFPGEVLDDNQLYFIRVETSSADGLVSAGIHNTDVYPNGSFHSSTGIADISRDLAFQVASGSNSNPVLALPIGNQNINEDAPYSFQFASNVFTDADVGDTLTYTATMADGSALPGWLSFDPLTRTFSGTPLNGDVGTISIRVTADDSMGGTPATDTFDLIIANTNDAPTVANPIADRNATEDQAFNFTFAANTFVDQDVGSTLTYSAQLGGGGALPSWLSFDSATRTFTGTPLNAHVGSVAIDVIASDGNGGTVTDTFTITVINTNDAPVVANPIANQIINEDAPYSFQFPLNTFSDPDAGNTLTYSAQLAGGAALPAWLNFNSATRTFSGTPTNGDVGNVSVELIASDGNGGSVTDYFDIEVTNVNDAPTVVIVPTDYYANEQIPINLHGTGIVVADEDGNPLTITLTGEGSNSNLAATAGTTGVVIVSGVDTNTLILTGTAAQLNDLFAGNNGGTLTYRLSGDTPVATRLLTISASDGSLSGNDTAIINITAVNDAPENTVPGAQATDEETALVFSSGNGNQIQVEDLDSGTSDLEITLSVTNGTLTLAGVAGLVFTTGDGASDSSMVFRGTQAAINTALATLTFNPTANFSGASVLSITTSDLGNTGSGGVLTDTDNINITVNAVNDAPTIANAIPNQNATEDAAFTFQFAPNTFADVDVSDTLTYTAQLAGGGALPTWLSFDSLTRTFSGTPLNANVGTVAIDVIANDGEGGTVTDTFDIVVANANDAPTIANAIPNQNATEDAAFNFQFAPNTFADVDVGDTLTYTAQLAGGGALPTWLSFDPLTRTFSGTPLNANVGTVSIDVIANDDEGGTVTDTFDIVVANSNDAPTIANAIPNQNAAEDAAFNFQFAPNTFADVDVGDALTYTAQLAGGGALPTWLSFDPLTRTFSGTPLNANVGTVAIDVIANDGNGGTVTDTFDIVVANANDAPTIANAIPNQNATEDAAFNFQFAPNTFADVDVSDTLTYTAQLAGGGALPTWLSFDPLTRTFSGTPLNANIGTVAIDVIANDGEGGTVTDTFDIVVANSNDAPTIANAISNQNATEDTAFTFQFATNTFADVDVGDTLTYTAQLAGGGALPTWLAFDPLTRTFSGTPLNANVGTVAIDVIANDGEGGTVTDTFDIVVSNANDTPTIANAIPNQNATEDAAFNFQFAPNTFADVDVGDTLTYTAQLAGGGALPTWLAFDPLTRTFSGTPLNANVGTVAIDVIANDGEGGTVTDTFDIVVANSNDAPTIANAIPDQNATEDSAFTFQFAPNTFADVDVSDTLIYTAQLAGGGALPTWLSFDPLTRTFSGTPLNANVGTVVIDVIADDGEGGTVTDTFDIVVANSNDAPTIANAIPNQNATEDAAFNFQFAPNTFADVDVSDALTYTAQLAGGGALPTWLSFDPLTRTFSGTPLNANVGTVAIDVIANDGEGGTITDTFDIVVTNSNDAPTIANAIPDQNATEDAAFNFQFASDVFADSDVGDTLTYTAQLAGGGALPTWLSFDPVTRTFSGTPLNANVGTVAIDVIANDGNSGTVTDTFDIIVINSNDAPLTSGLAPINTLEDATGDTVDLFAAFSDEETPSNQLQYSVIGNTNPGLVSSAVIDPVTGQLQLSYGANQFGSAELIIRAQDLQGASVETLLQVNIESVNDLPATTGIADVIVDAGAASQQMNLRTTFNDVEDGVQLTYSVIGNSNPAIVPNVQIDPATGVMAVSFSSSAGGESVITLRALDADGAWVDTQFKVTVTALDLGIEEPVSPQEPGKVPPTLPPTIPPTEPPVVEVPTTPPTSGGEVPPTLNPGGDNNTLAPGTGGAGSPGVINTGDERIDIGDVNDKSSRDYARAEELLNTNNVPLTVLTASTSLVSLIAPDAGFAPWEAADFDNEVRRLRAQMDDALEEEQDRKAVVAGLTFSVTTGLLVWSLRASSLLLTMMSMLPLWRGLDPLPILDEVDKKKKELEQQRKDREREDKSAKEVGYLFDHAQKKGPRS